MGSKIGTDGQQVAIDNALKAARTIRNNAQTIKAKANRVMRKSGRKNFDLDKSVNKNLNQLRRASLAALDSAVAEGKIPSIDAIKDELNNLNPSHHSSLDQTDGDSKKIAKQKKLSNNQTPQGTTVSIV